MNNNTLTLSKAITRDGKPVIDITLREPSAGELRGIKLFDLIQGDTGALIDLLPRISTPALNLVATMITGEAADDAEGKPSP